MYSKIKAALLLMAILTTGSVVADKGPDHEAELTAYVEDFLHPVRKMRGFTKRREKALANIPLVLKYCKQYRMDPILQGVVMSFEGSWRNNVVGKAGEIGVMQMMPKRFNKPFVSLCGKGKIKDLLQDPECQIHSGVAKLRHAFDSCGGDLEQSLNHYGRSYCKPIRSFVQYRLKAYHRALKKYRGQHEQ